MDITVGEGIELVEDIFTTARACGEITDYEASYLYEPASETLYADARYVIPAPLEYITVSFS
jgi:hypothetical protein